MADEIVEPDPEIREAITEALALLLNPVVRLNAVKGKLGDEEVNILFVSDGNTEGPDVDTYPIFIYVTSDIAERLVVPGLEREEVSDPGSEEEGGPGERADPASAG